MESYHKTFLSFREPILHARESARGRLVWFVGIAGYALINARSFWEALSIRNLTGGDYLCLSIPWIISAILSVTTHIVIDEAGVRNDLHFTKKLAAIELYRIKIKNGHADPAEAKQIFTDTHPYYVDAKKSADTLGWTPLSRQFIGVSLR